MDSGKKPSQMLPIHLAELAMLYHLNEGDLAEIAHSLLNKYFPPAEKYEDLEIPPECRAVRRMFERTDFL